ncbi:MAG: DUF805 domain-containing protein [Dokdonella sp.]
MNWFLMALKKYATFSGRSRRSEYWFFVLFYLIIYVVLAIIDGVAGTMSSESRFGLLSGLFALAMLIPSLAVGARRLHDTGRSGWWQLIGLIPLIGFIVLIVFYVQDSHPGSNQYGANPKEVAA